MKNPANPGDFGTNGTRGVVLSGMSETTKRALNADLIDLSAPWAKRIDPTHLAARPVDQQALRASRFGAEGAAERETTNSPAEVGAGCAGRKMALNWVAVWCVLMVVYEIIPMAFTCAALRMFGVWRARPLWMFGLAFALLGFLTAICIWFVEMRDSKLRASGGEGV
ncbi:hypothetical protein [Asaia sp. HN010]|uniref:hypothetical protein n=1 Tax=Asaia sp. HN010 TaxID=3081233 RepID=UPI003016C207